MAPIWAALALAACAGGREPTTQPATPETATVTTLDASDLALLQEPSTWCKGAKNLTKAGSAEAIGPLLAAFESRSEDERDCLIDAMRTLGAVAYAQRTATDPDPERRRAAAHLMELFVDPGHLAPLQVLAADADPKVRKQAAWAVRTQKQTPEWEATCVTLLGAEAPEVRVAMVKALARRRTDTARSALEARVAVEADARVKRELEKALR